MTSIRFFFSIKVCRKPGERHPKNVWLFGNKIIMMGGLRLLYSSLLQHDFNILMKTPHSVYTPAGFKHLAEVKTERR